MRFKLGSTDIDCFLSKYISPSGYHNLDKDDLKRIKEMYCYVSQDFAKELASEDVIKTSY
jgi:hypothetical protein